MEKLEHVLTEYYEGYSCHMFARGTTGLYSLFKALRDLKGAGEVIIPAICCETVALAAIYAGLKPVITDVNPENLCISYKSVLEKLSHDTVAIVLVYIFGNLFDPAPFQHLKTTHDIVLIEDIAQAVGGYNAGQRLGQRFDFTLLSFDDTKIIKGKGGAIIQRNPVYGDLLQSANKLLPPSPAPHILQRNQRSLRNIAHALFDLSRANPEVDISQIYQSMIPYYKNVFVRQDNILYEAPIIKQFQELKNEQEKRYEKYLFYKHAVKNDILDVVDFPPGTICWRLPVLIRDTVNMFYLTVLLRQHGILVSNHYFPLDKLFYHVQHPNAASIGARILNLWVDDLASMGYIRETVELLNSYRPIVLDA